MSSKMNGMNPFFIQAKNQSATWIAFARKNIKINTEINSKTILAGLFSTAHRAFLVLGLSAITLLCMMFFNPVLADRLKAVSPFGEPVKPQPVVVVTAPPLTNLLDAPTNKVVPAVVPAISNTSNTPNVPLMAKPALLTQEEVKDIGSSKQQQLVTNWLSKRYHVAGDATNMLVSASYLTAKETKLDPLLILAVMCIESGLNPFAESAVGAQGLMQVMSKIHRARFDELGGVKAALNPVANIRVGAMILKDFVIRGGSVEAGLKLYVGAAAFDNDAGYGAKVLAEYHRLQEVSQGKNVPITVAPVAPTAPIAPVAPSTPATSNTSAMTTAMKQQRLPDGVVGKPEPQVEKQFGPDSA